MRHKRLAHIAWPFFRFSVKKSCAPRVRSTLPASPFPYYGRPPKTSRAFSFYEAEMLHERGRRFILKEMGRAAKGGVLHREWLHVVHEQIIPVPCLLHAKRQRRYCRSSYTAFQILFSELHDNFVPQAGIDETLQQLAAALYE